MSTSMQEEPSLSLRLYVDKEKNTLVVAETSSDFVDTLFSFLTLPLGTIIRLVSPDFGCINNLYQSVKNSDSQVFRYDICKTLLLFPRNSCEELCKNLKLNVDDTEPTKHFICGSCGQGSRKMLSIFAGATCPCGRLMDHEIKLREDHLAEDVFVEHHHNQYLIFDDLRVLPNSPGNTIKLLNQFGYNDLTNVIEISEKVGLNQIKHLLKRALISKSPLTDVFLAQKDGLSDDPISYFRHTLAMASSQFTGVNSLKAKLIMSKSTNKVMFAEAEEDFCDFLFSFLTMPLGFILKLLHPSVNLGAMENLYGSVMDHHRNTADTELLDLKVAFQHGSVDQPLHIEENIPCYLSWFLNSFQNYEVKNRISQREPMQLFDPRSSNGWRDCPEGFVRRPLHFVVMDDLQVLTLPFSASIIMFLQKLNTSLDDLEEHEVTIGKIEALNLLGASLTSKAALTTGLSYLVKKPKQEANSDEPNRKKARSQ